jgi:hypothetical protein
MAMVVGLARKLMGENLKVVLCWVFNFKFGSFVMSGIRWHTQQLLHLELKTQPGFCPVGLSMSMVCHCHQSGNPHWWGRLNTVDLIVLTSLDRLIFILKILFTFLKTRHLNEGVSCTKPTSSVRVSCICKLTYLLEWVGVNYRPMPHSCKRTMVHPGTTN